MTLVVDASIIVDLLLRTSDVDTIEERIFDARVLLCAPELLLLEVPQVLRRWRAHRALSPRRAEEAFADFRALNLRYYALATLCDRAWQWRHNLTMYDASYLALAEALGATLLTRDKAFSRLRTQVSIEVI